MKRISKFWRTLGPGFLYAGAAVGVSHLVQSTKAGAEYGLLLIGVVLVSNFLKFPFFEAGPRYAAATGESLIKAYARIGKWAVWLFAALTFSTAFIIQAAVTVVTAVLLNNLLGVSWEAFISSGILLAICSLILLWGKYHLLDRVIKWVIVVLSLTSILAFFRATGLVQEQSLWPDWEWNPTSFIFLLALMGWMPAPLDIAAWQSVWTVEKHRDNQGAFSLKESLRDFHIGYWGTALLALVFLSLGAFVLFGSEMSLLQTSGAVFANSFISIYTETLGQWTKPLIAVAAFATMFSTTITVLDGAPRVFDELGSALGKRPFARGAVYRLAVLVIGVAAFAIIAFSGKQVMGKLVQMATITSFLTAPLLALLNVVVMQSSHMPDKAKPGKFTMGVAVMGLIFLFGFALLYLGYLLKPNWYF